MTYLKNDINTGLVLQSMMWMVALQALKLPLAGGFGRVSEARAFSPAEVDVDPGLR